MPIQLGYWATAGASSAAAPAFEQIATTYGNGSSTTITFNSIPTTYKHLQIRYTTKAAQGSNQFYLTYNGVSTGYAWHSLFGTSGVGSNNSSSATFINLQWGSAGNNATPIPASGIIDILDYRTSKNITTRFLYGIHNDPNAGSRIVLGSGMTTTTATVSSITMTFGGAVQTLSRFSLYGIKG